MKTEDFSNIASGIQNIAIIISLAVGGFWTYKTFGVLGTAAKARVDYEQALAALNGKVALEVGVKTLSETVDSRMYVFGKVVLMNKGSKDLKLDFVQNSALEVKRVSTSGDATAAWIEYVPLPEEAEGVLVRAASSFEIPFSVVVPGPGLYKVKFRSAAAADQSTVGRRNVSSRHAWTGSEFVVVR
jgi:hypothetical protein